MPAAAFAALLALQLASPGEQADRAPPPSPPALAAEDDAGDLARLGRLVERFDLAVLRRDLALLRRVEARVLEEVALEREEARRERRQGGERRQEVLHRAARAFTEARDRVDARSLDRKRAALAALTESAWREVAEGLDGRRPEAWSEPRDERRDRGREQAWAQAWDQPGGPDREERREIREDREEREAWRPPAPPPPPPPRIQPVDAARLEGVLAAMRREPWAEGRFRVLDAGLRDAWLTVEQLGRVLDLFTWASEQLEVVRRVRPRLVDPDQAYRLYQRFPFSADQEELRKILES